MKTLSIIASAAFSSAVALASYADPGVVWVDAKKGNDSTGARNRESNPYKTIQAAVDAAESGDEVKVRPGVYDSGAAYLPTFESSNLVLVRNKRLKIVSTGGPEVTHIVGNVDTSSAAGIGSGAVRCIAILNAPGTIVQGFTLRNGATSTTTSSTHPKCGGGAVEAIVIDSSNNRSYAATNAFVVGCVITNCYGQRGGAFRGVTALRCRIEDCRGDNSGSAGRDCSFVNCLITGNKGANVVYFGSYVVNCTIANNAGSVQNSPRVLNSIVLGNDGSSGVNVSTVALTNTLTCISGYDANLKGCFNSNTDALPDQFVSPLSGDWRIVSGSQAETAGDASLLAEVAADLPDGLDAYVDFYGDAIPQSGTIAAGCCQAAAQPTAHGSVLFSDAGTVLFDGRRIYGKNMYIGADAWPTQFTFQAVGKGDPAIFAFNVGGKYVYPTMDDVIYIVPPEESGSVVTCSVKAATTTIYVNPDPNVGSDSTTAGTDPSAPYRTLQIAYSAASRAGNYSVVRAAAGEYCEGGTANGTVSNRLEIAKAIRVIGAGRDKSVIRGHAAPSTGGLGDYAMRCIYRSAGAGCVQGFTLADGYTQSGTTDSYARRGGGVYCNATYANTDFHVLDCTITNCCSVRGGAGYSGSYERCHVVDCHSDGGVVRYAQMVSCVVDNLQSATMSGSGNSNVYGNPYYTTFIGRNTDEYVITTSDSALVNSLVVRTKALKGPASAIGSYAWDVPSFTATAITYADPMLADMDGGDYRPTVIVDKRTSKTTISPLLGGGTWYEVAGVNMTDFNGMPLNIIAGRPTAGAFQWPHVITIKNGMLLFIR